MTSSPTDHLSAVRRALATVTRDGEEHRLLTVHRTCDAAPAEVWSALTDAERVGRWLAPVTGDLEVGGRFALEGTAAGEVLDCVPAERLALSWEEDEQVSWVDVSLRPTDGGTLLQLDHTTAGDPVEDLGPGGAGTAWELALIGLVEHLRDPDTDPQVEDLDGFVAASGRAWAAADGD